MNIASLTDNEKEIMNILNYSDDLNDIWIPIQDIIDKINMSMSDFELTLYFLQIKRLIRINIGDNGNFKLTTEDKVETKLSTRVDSVLKEMEDAMQVAVKDENYEEAVKLRDWIKMTKTSSKNDDIIDSLINDIDYD